MIFFIGANYFVLLSRCWDTRENY